MSAEDDTIDKKIRQTIENLHPKERAVLHVIQQDSSEDYGEGCASTGDVRRETDLNNNDRRYRFETLEEDGIIEIKRDNSLTADGKPAEKVAVLTPFGQEIIDHGGVDGEVYESDEFDAEKRIREIEARLDTHDEFIEKVRDGINEQVLPGLRMLHKSVGELELALEENEPLSEVNLTEEKFGELNERLKKEIKE